MFDPKRETDAFVGGAEIVVGVHRSRDLYEGRDERKVQHGEGLIDHVGLLKIN
jgi:hypothetical protein